MSFARNVVIDGEVPQSLAIVDPGIVASAGD
jgi:hypothetical protein